MEIDLGIDGLKSTISGIDQGFSLILEVSLGEVREHMKTQFISQNLKKGMSAVVLLSRQSPKEFLKNLNSNGVDTNKCIKEDRLIIVDWYTHKRKRVLGIEEEANIIRSSRDILNVCISVNKALKMISESDSKIAYVDVVTEAANLFSWDKTKDYIIDIMNKFQENEFTTLYLIDKMVEDVTIPSFHPSINGIIKIFKENNKPKLSFESLNSELKNLDSLELTVEEKRVKVKEGDKKGDKKGVLVPTKSLRNISNKIFGKPNKEKDREKGWSGLKKGLTNGKTNGKVNGRTNGLTNGKTNGKVNGRT
ncbi:MAG: ATPase domain-containing protein, partial [Thermoplasmatota archaeon]